MMERLCGLAILVSLLALIACQRDEPRGLAEISGRMFVFNYRVATATYLVTLKRTAAIQEGSTIVADFENPRGGKALTISNRLFAHDDRIVLQSPPVECVKQNRPYAVTIRLKGGDGEILQTIETSVISDTDQSLLPAKPLVVGPIYTPNPEVFRADGTTDMRPVQDCPG